MYGFWITVWSNNSEDCLSHHSKLLDVDAGFDIYLEWGWRRDFVGFDGFAKAIGQQCFRVVHIKSSNQFVEASNVLSFIFPRKKAAYCVCKADVASGPAFGVSRLAFLEWPAPNLAFAALADPSLLGCCFLTVNRF